MKEQLNKLKTFILSREFLKLLAAFLLGILAYSCWNNRQLMDGLQQGTPEPEKTSSLFGCCKGN